MRRCVACPMLAIAALLGAGSSTPAWPQDGPVPPLRSQARIPAPPQDSRVLSPDQLDNLVAPVALYPDPLLGEVLAAATYPLEIVDAQQWLAQNRSLRGPQLIEAARSQNWDPSVQALVAFPDVLATLARSIRWTTDLGDAFLAQQAELMTAIQRMRSRAQQSGRLADTPQQTVARQFQDGQSAIEIQPADPQVMYTPVYNPAYVWGPPAYGDYPPMPYASPYTDNDYSGYNSGIGFNPGVFIGSLFTGLLKWSGWGWALNWFTHGLSLNSLFFNLLGSGGLASGGFGSGGGFSGYAAGGPGERIAWTHDPAHRLGVPYPNVSLTSRFGGRTVVDSGNWRRFGGSSRAPAPAPNAYPGRFAGNSFRASAEPGYRGGVSNFHESAPEVRSPARPLVESFRGPRENFRAPSENRGPGEGFRASSENFRGSSNFRSPGRSLPRAPSERSSFSASRSSAPRMPAQHFSAPRSSGRSPSGPKGGGGGHARGSSRSGSSHGSHSRSSKRH